MQDPFRYFKTSPPDQILVRYTFAFQDRTWTGQRANIPVGAAGKAAQAARSGAGCGEGGGVSARVDCQEVGGGVIMTENINSPLRVGGGAKTTAVEPSSR